MTHAPTTASDGTRAAGSQAGGRAGGRVNGGIVLVGVPLLPQAPADEGGEAAPGHDSHGRDALLEDAAEADDEDDDGTHVLKDDGGIGDEGPKVVGLQAGVSLEVLQEGDLIGVVVGVGLLHPEELLPGAVLAAAMVVAAPTAAAAAAAGPRSMGTLKGREDAAVQVAARW